MAHDDAYNTDACQVTVLCSILAFLITRPVTQSYIAILSIQPIEHGYVGVWNVTFCNRVFNSGLSTKPHLL